MGAKLNLTNQKFGRLTVIQESNKRIRNLVTWKCQCECGKIIDVTGQALRSGNTSSCGCLKKDALRERNLNSSSVIVGNRYGKLTVIQDLGLRKQKSRDKNWRWSLCQCDCGNTIEVANSLLANGHTSSCGCLQSQGEYVIEKILKENCQNYIKEYKFNDLVGTHNAPLRFDFAIFKGTELEYLIEFDGKQHYFGPEAKWTQGQSFETIKEHDKRKNNYCLSHNIILKRIPYSDIRKLNFEIISSNFYNIQEGDN